MDRITASFPVNNSYDFKQRMLHWASGFSVCCFLDSHDYSDPYHSYECILGAGAENIFSPEANVLAQLPSFMSAHNDWLFGHISYDVKNETELLTSSNEDHICFPDVFLFQPQTVIHLNNGEVTISCLSATPKEIFEEIKCIPLPFQNVQHSVDIQPRISKEKYIAIIEQLKQHILRGDCYEINFCQEFFSENTIVDPISIYQNLSLVSPTPFAAFYKVYDKYLFCASPERYLKKVGSKIISQPIKGTIGRKPDDAKVDKELKEELYNSAKDRSENVMVVDIVRNDLSKVCKEGSVHVEELFGIYSFPQLHQMISTIKGYLMEEINFADILKAAFPMGSMTGAPKKNVMQLIEKFESTKRAIYAGCLGYITPANDFDFNVVIRSIVYNSSNKYLSYQVGSGITFYSDAEKEYEECLLKTEAMKRVLLTSKTEE